ncbi:MAG: hypothetical protein Q7U47_03125, partial [Paludibacter sp.]|nr:hypothetical protein [Paludibacter sp.]
RKRKRNTLRVETCSKIKKLSYNTALSAIEIQHKAKKGFQRHLVAFRYVQQQKMKKKCNAETNYDNNNSLTNSQ